MNKVIITIALILCVSTISPQAQACCYECGIQGNYGVMCCSTAAECTAVADGCSVTVLPNATYGINCPGSFSICGVRADINCCVLYPGSSCCIGSSPDPCCSKPDDPCCPGKDPCCGNCDQCCQASKGGQHGPGGGGGNP
jgi:hypothetical protein